MLNVTEYLQQLFATGIEPGDLPVIQPLFQHFIWQQLAPGDGPGLLQAALALFTFGRLLPQAGWPLRNGQGRWWTSLTR